jgi:hypothetical protein
MRHFAISLFIHSFSFFTLFATGAHQTNAQVNLSDGLVAYYPFNNNAFDASGNANHGVASGSATYTSDQWGNPAACVAFGGTSNAGKVQVADSPTLNFTTGATFAFWARVNSATGTSGTGQVVSGGSQCLFAKSGDAGGGLWQLSQRVSSNLNHQIGNNGMSAFTGTIAPYTLGEWFHYTLTMDATGHQVHINGVLSSSNTVAANFAAMVNRNLAIGRFVSNWYPLNGAIDEFRVYNRVLNSEEISALQQEPLVSVTITSAIETAYCAGSAITVDFESVGDFATGNTYTLQLSNSAGSFANPIAIGSVSSSANSGEIALTIPAGLPSGSGYRIRLLSSAPLSTSSASTEFSILGVLGDIPDAGSLTYIGTSGGEAYFVSNTNLSWDASQAHAFANGGHLAVIPNPAANQLLQPFVQGSATWIGFSDAAIEGTWQWINGAPVSYTNWSSGEPNNSSNEDHGSMLPTGNWNDAANGSVRPYFFQLAPAGLPISVCAGGTIQLQAAALEGASYTWTGPVGFTSTVQNPAITDATPAQSGIYTVTYTKNGCTASASVSVTVNPAPAAPQTSYVLPSSLSQGLVLHYPMNGDAQDASGNNLHGTLSGGVTPVADRFGNSEGALQFNGTNGHIDVPDGVYFDGSSFSVSAWINKQANNNFSRLFDFGNGQQNNNILAFLTSGTNGRSGVQNYSTNSAQATTVTPSAQPLNQWFHFAYVWETGLARIFINGVQVIQGVQNAPVNVLRTLNYIGRSNWPNDAYANARFDDFRIYNRAITPVEIQSLVMEQPNDPSVSATPPVACASTTVQIILENSQFGVNYQLRRADNQVNIGTAQAGNGTTINFSTGVLTENTSFEIVATSTLSGCQIVFPAITVFVGTEPPAPSVTGATLCLEGIATLTASGAPPGAFYRWYELQTGGSPIEGETDASFTTELLFNSTTYYVSIVYNDGCESSRTPVTATVINPLSPPVDIDTGLILYYTFDNTLNDFSGNNYHGTASGTNTYVNDRNGNEASALNTISSNTPGNNWINAGNPAALQQLTNQVTISAWIRQTQTWFGSDGFDGQMPLINKWDGNTGMWMGLRMINPNNMTNRIRWRVNGTTFLESNTNVPVGSWHHVVCTYNGSQLRIYQNGILTGTLNHTGGIANTGADLFLGRQANGIPSGGITYRGGWDEVKMYNRALNPEEILTLFNNESVAFANTPFCDGEGNLALTTFAFPGASYNWSGPNGFSSTQQNPDLIINATSALNSGEYMLEVTVDGCTSEPQSVHAIIHPIPSAPQTTDASVCGGGSATLLASGAPEGAIYQWYTSESGGSPIPGQTGPSLLLNNITQSTTRWVSVLNNGCESPRTAVTAIFFDAADISLSTAGSQICETEPIAEVAILNTESDVLYQAFLNNTPVSNIEAGPGDLTLMVDAAMLSPGENTLTIQATQPGCATVTLSNSPVVVLNGASSPEITASGPLSICAGESITLTSSLANTYLWSDGSTSQSITVSQSGDYFLTATDSNGCEGVSEILSVSVNALPIPAISATADFICPDGTTSLMAIGAETYLWSTGTTGASLLVTQPGDYHVTGFNGPCQATSETVSITSAESPVVTASVSQTEICTGETVILTGNGADSYEWSNGAVNGQPVAVNSTTTFTVTGQVTGGCSGTASVQVTVLSLPQATITTNQTSLCNGENAQLTATLVSGASYQWLLNNIPISAATEHTFGTDEPGIYSVEVTTNCVAVSNSITISEGEVPGAAGPIAGVTSGICAGESGVFQINSVAGATSYLWSVSPPGAASIGSGQGTTSVIVNSTNLGFTVTVVPQNNCGSGPSSFTNVIVSAGFPCDAEVMFAANETAVCTNNQVVFTNYTDPDIFFGLTPQWSFGTGATPGTSTSPSPVTVIYSTPGPKTVTLNYVDLFGNSFASEVKVNYINVTDGIVTSPIEGAVLVSCDNSSETYSVENNEGSVYEWTVPDGADIISGQGTATIEVDFNGNFGEISVIETAGLGCSGAPVTVIVQCTIDVLESERSEISAYPNPASDILNVEVPYADGTTILELTDASGRVLLQQRVYIRNELPVKDLAQGIYFLVVRKGSVQEVIRFMKY